MNSNDLDADRGLDRWRRACGGTFIHGGIAIAVPLATEIYFGIGRRLGIIDSFDPKPVVHCLGALTIISVAWLLVWPVMLWRSGPGQSRYFAIFLGSAAMAGLLAIAFLGLLVSTINVH